MMYQNNTYIIKKVRPNNYLIDVYEPRLYHTYLPKYTSFGLYIKRINAIRTIRTFIDRDIGLMVAPNTWKTMLTEYKNLFSGAAGDEQIRLGKLTEWLENRQKRAVTLYKLAPRNITTDDLDWFLSLSWWECKEEVKQKEGIV